jgi:hypothetical protein
MGIVRKLVAAVAVAGAIAGLSLSVVSTDNAGGFIGGGTTVTTQGGQGSWPQKG